jgi:hypothetical protein
MTGQSGGDSPSEKSIDSADEELECQICGELSVTIVEPYLCQQHEKGLIALMNEDRFRETPGESSVQRKMRKKNIRNARERYLRTQKMAVLRRHNDATARADARELLTEETKRNYKAGDSSARADARQLLTEETKRNYKAGDSSARADARQLLTEETKRNYKAGDSSARTTARGIQHEERRKELRSTDRISRSQARESADIPMSSRLRGKQRETRGDAEIAVDEYLTSMRYIRKKYIDMERVMDAQESTGYVSPVDDFNSSSESDDSESEYEIGDELSEDSNEIRKRKGNPNTKRRKRTARVDVENPALLPREKAEEMDDKFILCPLTQETSDRIAAEVSRARKEKYIEKVSNFQTN